AACANRPGPGGGPMRKAAFRALRGVAVAFLGLLAARPAAAQQTPPAAPDAPNVADLERRVRELEEIVRRLEAERERDRADRQDETPQRPTGSTTDYGPQANPLNAVLPPSGSGVADRLRNVGSSSSSTAGWDNGFFLRSQDKRFLLRLTGQLQA